MYLNLSLVLKKNKITQKEFAKQIGISERTLTSRMNGHSDWTFGEVQKIWKIFPSEDPKNLMEKIDG